MLSASMLETANKGYPTAQVSLENIWQHCMEQICQLMRIEGGQSHLVDVSLTYVRDEFLSKKNVLTSQIFRIIAPGSVYTIVG